MNIDDFIAARDHFTAMGDRRATRFLNEFIDHINDLTANFPPDEIEDVIVDWFSGYYHRHQRADPPANPVAGAEPAYTDADRNARAKLLEDHLLELAHLDAINYLNNQYLNPYLNNRVDLDPQEVN